MTREAATLRIATDEQTGLVTLTFEAPSATRAVVLDVEEAKRLLDVMQKRAAERNDRGTVSYRDLFMEALGRNPFAD